ncbi:aldo/keto reductase [Deinococcus hopiensis]|uniref:Predicted oxidoreductase n=1 Tax=Deinococcus hopiensis KR-140 TaxID=695939 RepID=A0A1W1UDB6_9DEIO|nr:aldo/keto reductase [Deinococcus hopiensis]SMB78811.1 Predicted oxidoreductase [Deinococcus hopiensis KR-140]
MEHRTLGKTGYEISSIGFGAWAIGGTWGEVDDTQSLAALHRALDLGVNFFDTADVYGDGHSERLLRRLRRERSEPFVIATKAGRRLDPHVASGYNRENLRAFVERSLQNLGVEALDLLQLHCPPSVVYGQDEIFEILDDLVREGSLRAYGVSVETVAEALTAIRHPGVATVQIIFNAFRLKPAEEFFAAAREADVGIIARVPLASGLLTGKLRRDTPFASDDHRAFNRHGEAFDRGETFSGVDYEVGLEAARQLQELVPPGTTLAQFALRWILMFPEVSCAIPGARTPAQAESNATAADLPPLTEAQMQAVRRVYDALLRAQVHPLW